jgi:hypothetical protein
LQTQILGKLRLDNLEFQACLHTTARPIKTINKQIYKYIERWGGRNENNGYLWIIFINFVILHFSNYFQ